MASIKNVSTDTKNKPVGRPRQLDREMGVVVAEALFHHHGYDALGIKAICDAIGVRQPALYAAYGSKAALFTAALERYAGGPYAAFVADSLNDASTPETAFRAVLSAAARRYAVDPERTGCLALEASTNASEPAARQSATDLVEATRAALAIRYTALGAIAPDAWADATIAGMRGLSAEARAGRSTDALVAAASIFVAETPSEKIDTDSA